MGHFEVKRHENVYDTFVQIMATPEERRSPNHLIHEVTIDELQQLTDLLAEQVINSV